MRFLEMMKEHFRNGFSLNEVVGMMSKHYFDYMSCEDDARWARESVEAELQLEEMKV